MELDFERAAPSREAGRERNVSADSFGAVHGIVEEQLRERLVDEFLLWLEPTSTEDHHVFDRQNALGADLCAEGQNAELRAGLPVGGVEHGLRLNEIVGVRILGRVTVAEAGKGENAFEVFVFEELSEVDLVSEVDLLIPKSARAFFAVHDTEECALIVTVERNAFCCELLAQVKAEIATAAEHVFAIPPIVERLRAVVIRRWHSLSTNRSRGSGKNLAVFDFDRPFEQ